MAAVLSFALGSLVERATAAPPLASPALAVKAERQRSYTVLEKRRHEEIEQRAAGKVTHSTSLKMGYFSVPSDQSNGPSYEFFINEALHFISDLSQFLFIKSSMIGSMSNCT